MSSILLLSILLALFIQTSAFLSVSSLGAGCSSSNSRRMGCSVCNMHETEKNQLKAFRGVATKLASRDQGSMSATYPRTSELDSMLINLGLKVMLQDFVRISVCFTNRYSVAGMQ